MCMLVKAYRYKFFKAHELVRDLGTLNAGERFPADREPGLSLPT